MSLGFLVAAHLLSHGCATAQDAFPPSTYSAKAIRATAVDSTTAQPLEGVVVVARWVLRRSGGDGPRLHLAEAVTNGQGEFLIPGWGPKPRPALMVLQDKSPQLLLFKHGYVPLTLRSGESKEEFAKTYANYRDLKARDISMLMRIEGQPDRAVQEAFWDGLIIQMEVFQGTREKWFQLLESFASDPVSDDGRQIPRFLEAIYAERPFFDLNTLSPYNRGVVESFFSSVKRAQE